jgi:hypothetical protein
VRVRGLPVAGCATGPLGRRAAEVKPGSTWTLPSLPSTSPAMPADEEM